MAERPNGLGLAGPIRRQHGLAGAASSARPVVVITHSRWHGGCWLTGGQLGTRSSPGPPVWRVEDTGGERRWTRPRGGRRRRSRSRSDAVGQLYRRGQRARWRRAGKQGRAAGRGRRGKMGRGRWQNGADVWTSPGVAQARASNEFKYF
jgi:hypothetical protein